MAILSPKTLYMDLLRLTYKSKRTSTPQALVSLDPILQFNTSISGPPTSLVHFVSFHGIISQCLSCSSSLIEIIRLLKGQRPALSHSHTAPCIVQQSTPNALPCIRRVSHGRFIPTRTPNINSNAHTHTHTSFTISPFHSHSTAQTLIS